MNKRDELAALLHGQPIHTVYGTTTHINMIEAAEIADEILAAGYSKAEVTE